MTDEETKAIAAANRARLEHLCAARARVVSAIQDLEMVGAHLRDGLGAIQNPASPEVVAATALAQRVEARLSNLIRRIPV